MIQTHVPAASGPAREGSFPWPNDGQAWWSFLAGQLGGWALLFGFGVSQEGLALAAAAFSLFFASDWLSHVGGHSREGAVKPAAFEPLGLALIGMTAVSLAAFMVLLSPAAREAWAIVVTGVACLVALMFILRLEMRPLDGRLLYLTHVILTLPALTLGFLRYGVGAPEAFRFWMLPAVYYPAQALFAHYWMEGTDAPGESLSVLAGPLLAGILLEAWTGGWMGAAFLALFLGRAVFLLQRRRASGQSLPGFAEVRRLSREFMAWNIAGLLAWAVCVNWG